MSTEALVIGGRPLRGRLRVPSDKSISHRSLIFNSVSRGRACVRDLLGSADVRSTARCLRGLGVRIEDQPDGSVIVHGTDWGLTEPSSVLDCGNSGTTMRLLTGLLSGQPFHSVLTGDGSLRRRPMSRVTVPLRRMGAHLDGRDGGDLAPLSIRGGALSGRLFRPLVASAQVKTSLLLAGLQSRGEQSIDEPHLSRDHSERMLTAMGARLERAGTRCSVSAGPLEAVDIDVPGDISSAAFFLVMASIIPGSELLLSGVGMNPTRTGVYDVLLRMGADIAVESSRVVSGEPVADLVVRSTGLRGVTIGGSDIPRLIDEIPVLAVAAACAEGETVISDASELRVKESDRIEATVALLRAVGAQVTPCPDGMVIAGGGGLRAGVIEAFDDHRIAMAGAAALAAGPGEGTIRGAGAVDVSFPGFFSLLRGLQR
jgi:3-phosphoshikimate 1-carboxyvinyltransferase